MSTTWVEVADTAVKVGLGALISGLSGYWIASKAHQSTITKDIIARKVSLLESAAALAEEYFYYCTRLNNVVGGILKHAQNAGQEQTPQQRALIHKCDSGLDAALEKCNQAISKLELLGAPQAGVSLKEYNIVLREYREVVIHQGRLLAEEERVNLTNRYSILKANFYSATSRYFSSLES